MKNNKNRGMSLVELMVAVSILSLIMLAIGAILSSMSKNFGQSQREVALQDNMQATYSVVSDLVKSAQVVPDGTHNVAVYKDTNNNFYILEETFDQTKGLAEKKKVAQNDATGHIIRYNPSTHKLYLYTTSYDRIVTGSTTFEFNATSFKEKMTDIGSAGSTKIEKPEYLLANNVVDFDIVTKLDKGYVIVNLELENGGRKATITQNVYLRNSNKAVQWVEGSEETGTTITATPTSTPIVNPGTNAELLKPGTLFTDPVISEIRHTVQDIDVQYASKNTLVDPVNVETKSYTEYTVTYECTECSTKMYAKTWGQDSSGNNGNVEFYNNPEFTGTKGFCSDSCSARTQNRSRGGVTVKDGEIIAKDDLGNWKMKGTKSQEEKTVTLPIYYDDYTGQIIIKNTSLTKEYYNVEVVVYFEDDNAKFESTDDINLDTSLTTGGQQCTFSYSQLDANSHFKFLKISIPYIKAAEKDPSNDKKIKYDQYVFTYEWTGVTTDNPPVLCTHSVTGL